MKKKMYSVLYEVTTSYEAIVAANNKDEAIAKVTEVIGDPIVIEGVHEVRRRT